jgi:hypothetical protein
MQVWQGSGRDGASRPDGIRARRSVTPGRDRGATEPLRPGREIDGHRVRRMHTTMHRECGSTFRDGDPSARLVDIPCHVRCVPHDIGRGNGGRATASPTGDRPAVDDHCTSGARHQPGSGWVVRTSGPSETNQCVADAVASAGPGEGAGGPTDCTERRLRGDGDDRDHGRPPFGVGRECNWWCREPCSRRVNSSDILIDRATHSSKWRGIAGPNTRERPGTDRSRGVQGWSA